jgi:hypothetical protein
MKSKVRIISDDGRFWGTSVVDAETGQQIPRVVSIKLDGDVDGFWQAKIEVLAPSMDLLAETEYLFRYAINDLHRLRETFIRAMERDQNTDKAVKDFIEFIDNINS